MTGESYDREDQRLDAQEHEFAQRMQPRIPGMVASLMKSDRELRELIVTALRIRFALSYAEWGPEFANSPTGMHIADVLDEYSGDPPEALDERRFANLIEKFQVWAAERGYMDI
jgi:hypothetical protein